MNTGRTLPTHVRQVVVEVGRAVCDHVISIEESFHQSISLHCIEGSTLGSTASVLGENDPAGHVGVLASPPEEF